MVKMWRLLTILTGLCGWGAAETVNKNLVNKNVERIIDLSSQLVKITSTLTLENAGAEPALFFHVFPEPGEVGALSYVSVRDSEKNELKLTKTEEGFRATLNSQLNAGRSANLIIEYVYTNALTPYPSAIAQKERQLVRYFGSHYFYSPYKTVKQTTTLTLNSRAVESYTKLKPVSQLDSTINYGPYQNVEGSTYDQMVVHFESNAPFLTVTRIERLIEISHWGNIAVQENIEILHSGAKLKGPFSRYDYQRDTGNSHHSIKSYHTALPAAAHSIYYRDSNGNISTSQVRIKKDWIELELRPRYPLFGGWKSSYTLGYSVPSYQYLMKSASGQFLLRMRLLDHVFDDMYVKELETSIVLPVGVQNVKLNLPYEVDRLPDTVTYKYLDTIGRKVVNIRKTNLVEQHIQDLEIVYNWQPLLLFHEPILLTLALYGLFIIVIIYVRLDFSIHRPDHAKKE